MELAQMNSETASAEIAKLTEQRDILLRACKQMQKSLNGSPADFAGMLAAHRMLDAAVKLVETTK